MATEVKIGKLVKFISLLTYSLFRLYNVILFRRRLSIFPLNLRSCIIDYCSKTGINLRLNISILETGIVSQGF
ncbi:hypothetical protein XENTR_v10002990 [Xenopus tropicalis]|nr:hypothetical protein XENTR_v10002990 [Xenopus tropicalis]